MLGEQGGVCAICGQKETSTYRGKVRKLAVDHCHKTGRVRGLLCMNCNQGLGKFQHSHELLIKAATYAATV